MAWCGQLRLEICQILRCFDVAVAVSVGVVVAAAVSVGVVVVVEFITSVEGLVADLDALFIVDVSEMTKITSSFEIHQGQYYSFLVFELQFFPMENSSQRENGDNRPWWISASIN